MSTPVDPRLVRLGLPYLRAALVEQGLVTEGLAKEFSATLKTYGWSDTKAKSLRATIELLQSAEATQADQRDDARTAHGGELAAKANAKAFVRKLRLAWPLALRDAGGKVAVAADAIESGGELGRSTPKIIAYLTTVAPAVKALDAQLKVYFGGVSPTATLAQLRPALEGADTTQELELAQVPESTQRIYEAKGRLVEAITEINTLGRIAFDGDAVQRARFNKDLILRAHQGKQTPAVTPAG